MSTAVSGPWQKYANERGPWEKYAATSAEIEIPEPTAQARQRLERIPQFTDPTSRLRAEFELAERGPLELEQVRRLNEANRASGQFIGMAAGAMALPASLLSGPGWRAFLGRAGLSGVGTGGGALVGGATPGEALQTGATGAVLRPLAEGIGAGVSRLVRAKPIARPIASEEWRNINQAIGAKPKDIRIGESATSLEEAATNPGRTLQALGVKSEELVKMTPLEQQAVIAPMRQRAAVRLNQAFDAATARGIKFDVGKSSFEIFKRNKDARIQEQMIKEFNRLAKSVGIKNQRAATPAEARALREALKGGANFAQGGRFGTLAEARAELYRGVNRDLHGAAPELKLFDQQFSDLKTASSAVRGQVAKFAVEAPVPGPTFRERAVTVGTEVLPWLLRGTAPGAGRAYALFDALRRIGGR